MSDAIAGGWSAWHSPVSEEAKTVLGEALAGWVGAKFEPLAFATQLVSGTNYAYLALATPVVPNAKAHPVSITVYKPLQGKAHITQIKDINP